MTGRWPSKRSAIISSQGRVDEAQPQAFASAYRLGVRDRAVERHRVANPAGHPSFHHVAETRCNLRIRRQSPIGEHPQHIAIDRDRYCFFDDQRACETTPQLLQAVRVRVIPERSGVGRRERVDKLFARVDRRLRKARHAVHRIRQAHAMPVDRGVLG